LSTNEAEISINLKVLEAHPEGYINFLFDTQRCTTKIDEIMGQPPLQAFCKGNSFSSGDDEHQ
jgi:hypothetical protein